MEKMKVETDDSEIKTDEEKKEVEEEEDSAAKAAKELKRNETLEKIPEEDETKEHPPVGNKVTGNEINSDGTKLPTDKTTEAANQTADDSYFPVKGPEVEEFLKTIKDSTEKIKAITSAISGSVINEPFTIEINKSGNIGVEMTHKVNFKTGDDIFNEASSLIENMFKYRAMDFDGGEEEEEDAEDDEDEEGEEEQEAEEEEEEEDDDDVFDPTAKDKNLLLGDTNHYDPVSLSVKQILMPGNPEFQCKYREKIYRFISEENRAQFMENPEKFLTSKKNPQVRISLFF